MYWKQGKHQKVNIAQPFIFGHWSWTEKSGENMTLTLRMMGYYGVFFDKECQTVSIPALLESSGTRREKWANQ